MAAKIEGVVDDGCKLRKPLGGSGNRDSRIGWPLLAARPSLFDKKGQILCPVVGGHTAGIDHVSQIIFGISQHKRRVIHPIIVGSVRRFAGRRDVCRALGRCDGDFTSCQADKASIEIIQPGSQYGSAIPIGISGDKNHLNLFPDLRRQLLQAARDIGHVERTFIRAMSIAEKQQRDVALGLRPKVKRRTGCIGLGARGPIRVDI